MPIPEYSVFLPGQKIPASFPIKVGLAGYQMNAAGQLITPWEAIQAPMLVFHDITPIPAENSSRLAAQLTQAAAALNAQYIYADLERPPDQASISLLQMLRQHTAHLLIPARYASHTGGEPVLFWTPSMGAFSAFLQNQRARFSGPLWLEYAPVCQHIRLTDSTKQERLISPAELSAQLPAGSSIHNSEAFHCRYATTCQRGFMHLYLWDTVQTLAEKYTLAEQHGLQGIITLHDEIAGIRQSDLP